MEQNPYSISPEDDDEDDDEDDSGSKARKNASVFEGLLDALKKPDEDKDSDKPIGQSLFAAKERDEEKTETEEDISPEETAEINRSIAEEHLNNPIETPPEPAVTEFLEEVAEAGRPEEARENVIEEYDLKPDDETLELEHEASVSPAEEPEEDADSSATAARTTGLGPRTTPQHQASQSRQTRTATASPPPPPPPPPPPYTGGPTLPPPPGGGNNLPPNRPNNYPSPASGEKSKTASSFLAGELAGYIIGRRIGSKKTAEKLAVRQKKLEKKVKSMEDSLSGQERELQRLSLEKAIKKEASAEPVIMPVEVPIAVRGAVPPPERTTPSQVESRLYLNKPQRAEHLGKIVVAAERPAKAEKSPPEPRVLKIKDMNPEYIKTMQRRDLLDISGKIKVEGGSLRSMYENDLFSERALRRLVAAHIRGENLLPLMRKEILEKQIDFERDPQVRDRGIGEEAVGSGLFKQMLDKTPDNKQKPTAAVSPVRQAVTDKPAEDNKSAGPANWIIAILIVLLIGLILLLLFKHY